MKRKLVALSNGETISYYTKGSGVKHLLLIHGNTSSALFFEPIVEHLSNEFTIIMPDLRGFGNSSYNNEFNTLLELAEDLNLLLKHLKITETAVLGWSMGGGVALELATTYPNLVNKLILLSSASIKGYPVFKKDEKGQVLFPEIYNKKSDMALDIVQVLPLLNAQKTQDINFMKQIFDLVIYTGNKKPNDEDNTRWLNDALKQRNLVDVDWALANFNISNEPSPYSQGNNKIANLKADTLIIWGDKDLTVPKIMFEENVNGIKNNKSIIYEGAGHSIIAEEPEKLANDINNFILK